MFRSLRRLVTVALFGLAASSSAWAGAPVLLQANPFGLHLTSTGVHTPVTQTFTIDFNANGNQSEAAQLNALTFQLDNFADFAVVGGTCQPGITLLDSSTPSCTVIVQYTPSTSGAEDATLFATCTSVGLAGGTAIFCNGTSASFNPVSGAVAAVLTQLPTLGPYLLTLLASLLIGIGAYFASRKTV